MKLSLKLNEETNTWELLSLNLENSILKTDQIAGILTFFTYHPNLFHKALEILSEEAGDEAVNSALRILINHTNKNSDILQGRLVYETPIIPALGIRK